MAASMDVVYLQVVASYMRGRRIKNKHVNLTRILDKRSAPFTYGSGVGVKRLFRRSTSCLYIIPSFRVPSAVATAVISVAIDQMLLAVLMDSNPLEII